MSCLNVIYVLNVHSNLANVKLVDLWLHSLTLWCRSFHHICLCLDRLCKSVQWKYCSLLVVMLKVLVSFWSCDAYYLCQLGLSPDIKFDVIDTSNLSDHTSLLNVLVCCGQRLKKLVNTLSV